MFHMVNRLKRCFKMFQNGVEWAKRNPRGMTYVQCASPEHEMLNMAHRTSVKTKKKAGNWIDKPKCECYNPNNSS